MTGSIAGSDLTAAAGATLGGSGSIGGAVTVNGALAPGTNGIGALSANNTLTLASTATATLELNKTGATLTNDRVRGVSNLTYGGTHAVTESGDPFAVGDTFILFSASTYSGAFSTLSLPIRSI